MATQNFETLRARAQALGYRLYATADGEQLVVDHFPDSDRTPEVVFIHEDEEDDDLEEWIADREQVSERVRHAARFRSDQLDCIRMQAERVVRAYHELREAPKNADFKSDDFPVGLFAALVQQIKLLDGWPEPSQAAARTTGPNEEFAERVGAQVDALDRAREDAHEAVHEIRGLVGAAELLAEESSGDDRLEVLLRVALAKLKSLSEALDIVNFGKAS